MSSSLSRRESFAILDLPSNASQDEIRQAYRTKAMDNHPDKNPDDPLATQRFQRISQAYRVLAEGTNRYDEDSDGESDEEYGGGLGYMFFFRMFADILRREEEARRMRHQSLEEILLEELFGRQFYDPWQQPPHRRRETWSPPRRTTQPTWGRPSSQSSRTSEHSSRTSQPTGRTSQQTWRTSQQTGRTSQQTRGRTSKPTSGWPTQTNGRTSQQDSCKSSQQKTQRSTPLTRKNKSRAGKENETPQGNDKGRHSSAENTYTPFKNPQEKDCQDSDDEGSKHKPSSESPSEDCAHTEPSYPVGGDPEWDQTTDPSESEVSTAGSETNSNQNQRSTSSFKHRTTFETYKPKKLSKRQLLAQHKRRAREAAEIGQEVRKKTELISNDQKSS
ncbi:chaperone protein DnaJ-like [Asterias rubens]|uniref:chaperone protein DnaJ-like n=1 Tax=Asterias rubens TaxID=7604 RepID=UPI0014552ECB|nr:chaperone protein DnaJ-like [Asterias rubens]